MTLPLFDATPLQTLPVKKARPYQERGINQIRALVMSGKRRILVVSATGSGKMFVAASIIKTSTLPVLFVTHRKEILDQCSRQLAMQGITNIGVIRGNDDRWNPYASVQLGSVATLARRDRPFLGKEIILIADEAHRCGADAWRDLIFAFDKPILIGFTATPVRLDGRPLGGDLFEEILQLASYSELLKRPDWLVAPDCFAGRERADLSSVHTAGSDFDETDLARVMRTDRLEGDIVRHWLERAHLHPVFMPNGDRVPKAFNEGPRRRTILFAVNIDHSESLAARFEKQGARVAHLDGTTPEAQRDAMFRDLASGALEIICNCQVAVEGVDVPEIKCVIHACPTMSLTKHRQSVGRAMRPWNNVVPIYLDHAGNFDRLGCPFEDLAWSLKERPKRFGGRAPMKLCHTCFAYVEPGKILCPFCGAEFSASQQREVPKESQEVLELRNTEPDALKWAFFWRQVVMAKAKGFKPGFASKIFKDHYGAWPPKHWSEKIKTDFAQDTLWQETLARRLERKAAREARERQENEAMGEKSVEAIALEEARERMAQPPSELEQQMEQTAAAMNDSPCTMCDGYGARGSGCTLCGLVTIETSPELSCTGCGGSGEDDGQACSFCGGTGTVSLGDSPFADWLEGEGIR